MKVKLLFTISIVILFAGGCKKKYSNELLEDEISLAVDLNPKGIKQEGNSLYSYEINGVIMASKKVDMSSYGFIFTPVYDESSYINKYGPASKLGVVTTTFKNMPLLNYSKIIFYIVLINGDSIKSDDPL